MSRGISWRQHTMLRSIAHHTKQTRLVWVSRDPPKCIQQPVLEPVAWRSIDRGPGGEDREDYFTAHAEWNREQTVRRALRSLERRGLIKLGRYVFTAEPISRLGTSIEWRCTDPDNHSPSGGLTRIMSGALLTEAGWALVRANAQAASAGAEP